MKKMWRIGLLSLTVAGLLAGCGAGGDGGANSDQQAGAQKLEVPTVYQNNCLSCHGNQLQGRTGPNLQKVGSKLNEEQILKLIREGKGGMPAYGNRLSEDELTSLASWLAQQK